MSELTNEMLEAEDALDAEDQFEEAMKELIPDLEGYQDHCYNTEQGQVAELIDAAIDRIAELSQPWISVDDDEEIPEGEIMAFNAEYGEGHIHKALSNGRGYISETETIHSKRLYKVTHWMPLPSIPDTTGDEG